MRAKRPAGSVYDRFRPLLADKRRRYAVSSRARSLAQHAVLFFFSLSVVAGRLLCPRPVFCRLACGLRGIYGSRAAE